MSKKSPKEILWVSILVSLSLMVLVSLFLWPATGWLVRLQLISQILPIAAQDREADERRVAEANPLDYQIQLARTLTTPYPVDSTRPMNSLPNSTVKVQRLHELATRFPNEPSVYAHALRFATMGAVLLRRQEQDELLAVPPVNSAAKVRQIKPEDLEAFERDAANGERLAPDNAYFPLMRAIGFYAVHKDAEAIAAIHRAGLKTRYEDFTSMEFSCVDKFSTLAHGQRGVIARTAMAAAILFPHYAQIRALSRMGTVSAIHMELNGNAEEGFAIRRDLMRAGALMREQGHSLICNLVGIAVTAIPVGRPGGTPAIKSPDDYSKLTEDQKIQRSREKREKYYRYIASIGHADEARWIEAEADAGMQVKAACKKIGAVGPFSTGALLQTGCWWLLNLLTLTNAIGLLILGAAAGLASTIAPKKHLKLCRGLFGLIIAGVFALWLFNVERGLTNWVTAPIQLFQAIGNMQDNNTDMHGAEMLLQIGAMTLALALPLLLMLIIGILSMTMKVPLATGLGRGLRGLALPLACLLFIAYGLLVVGTARSETNLNTVLESNAAHEGQTIASMLGQKWPGAAPR